MTDINYSLELFDYVSSLSQDGTLETHSPEPTTDIINNFTPGEHFRTKAETGTNSLILSLQDLLLTVVVDESGSMTWNDKNGDRYTFLKRLLGILEATYPGVIRANLYGIGGIAVVANLLALPLADTQTTDSTTVSGFNRVLQQLLEDSVYDLSYITVVRNSNHYPATPQDGALVFRGLAEAVKDENLTTDSTYYYGIWTFNKNNLPDAGHFIKATPRERILPKGVAFAETTTRILPGILRDSTSEIIFNFSERSGSAVFDSSGLNNHATIYGNVDNFWLGDSPENYINSDGYTPSPIGARFNGEEIYVESSIYSINTPLSVNFWIYIQSFTDQWITGALDSTNKVVWGVGIKSNGDVGIALYSDFSALPTLTDVPGSTIPLKTWTMVTVVFDSVVSVYINGVLKNTIANSGINYSSTRLRIGNPVISWNGNPFYGVLNLLSVNSSVEDASILYTLTSDIFSGKTLAENNQQIPDNTQREVLLHWTIPTNFDYETVFLRRKYNSLPTYSEDGDLVLSENASAGDFYYLDTYDFIDGGTYYYRVFTKNSTGNYCDLSDARILATYMPGFIPRSFMSQPLPVANGTATAGNKKILLTWENPSLSDEWRGTRVYYGSQGYPEISSASDGSIEVANGTLLTDTTDIFYVHRDNGLNKTGTLNHLNNGENHYYSIFTYNSLGTLSSAVHLSAIPSESSTAIFPPSTINDLHIDLVNPTTLSLQWTNPTFCSDELDLWMDEGAAIYANIRDALGGGVNNLDNLSISSCIDAEIRASVANTNPIGVFTTGSTNDFSGISTPFAGNTDCASTYTSEMNINYAAVSSGLIKGFLAPKRDREILSQRTKYIVDLWTQCKINNPETNDIIFNLNTKAIRINFYHPLNISAVNIGNKKVFLSCYDMGSTKGTPACPCNVNPCEAAEFDGSFINAKDPYLVRVEVQWKDGSLPNGTSVYVSAWKANTNQTVAPSYVQFNNGLYATSPIEINETDSKGNVTGRVINKSYVDVPINAPSLPEDIELLISIDYQGFFVQVTNLVHFVAVLRIVLDSYFPYPDGITVGEQKATVFFVDPDDTTKRLPVADGTIVKWEMIKGRYGKERPFYSTDTSAMNLQVSGVYSLTTDGVARNVFFGPISDIKNHDLPDNKCNGEADPCCIGEEYTIKATALYGNLQAVDSYIFHYSCRSKDKPVGYRFLMNASTETTGSYPHWVTWADGDNLLRFQIAKNPALSTIQNADCFRTCVLNHEGAQLITLPDNQVISVTGPGEILWNVVFKDDPYDPYDDPYHPDRPKKFSDIDTYESISDTTAENLGIQKVANIPLTGDVTEFYIRYPYFIDQNNPIPDNSCQSSGSVFNIGNDPNTVLPCDWKGICSCPVTKGTKWINVTPVSGTTTIISNGKEVTLYGGGIYNEGIPPVYAGFREPLNVQIVDLRVNGARVEKPLVDFRSRNTFVVEVTFAGEPVPDGTQVYVDVSGDSTNSVLLSDCIGVEEECHSSRTGIVYTTQVNDSLLNPTGDLRSLAYITIEPIPQITFVSYLNVSCKYDKLGITVRNFKQQFQIMNTVNETPEEEAASESSQTPTSNKNNPVVNKVFTYNTNTQVVTDKNGCKINRMGAFAGYSSLTGRIYISGGFVGSGTKYNIITPRSEKFLVSDDPYSAYDDPYADNVWEYTTDIPTPRAFGETVYDDNYMYCIGGVEYNTLLGNLQISQKIERFEYTTESWTELTEMPDNYGIGFGSAFLYNNYIYVVSGLNSITNDTLPQTLNTNILRYSIINNSWDIITVSNTNLFSRISPFFFQNSSTCTIYSGSLPKARIEIETERSNRINSLANDYISKMYNSSYYQGLTLQEQESFISNYKNQLSQEINIPAYSYPASGYEFIAGSEILVNGVLTITINTLNWTTLPKVRSQGMSVTKNTKGYLLGGTNQNTSTTLNIIEEIDI